MWLLSTDRGELHWFPSLEKARLEGYAILSHIWDENEQTFQETQALSKTCSRFFLNPLWFSSPKVREACKLAQRCGYKWLWDDTCCIDKTSSSDLSEAINSMFSYYAHAEVCYAYLKDVPSSFRLDLDESALRNSTWFKRGWTLQELIAPQLVIFLSVDWHVICTKASHAMLFERITRVPRSVLRMEEDVRNMSIACRMSWAAVRQTTRPEDEAYCLMGIFDIHMPTLYGEGRNAFRRLQEEIMKRSIDTTLFAWGFVVHDFGRGDTFNGRAHEESGLFALSPREFLISGKIAFARDTLRLLHDTFAQSDPVSQLHP